MIQARLAVVPFLALIVGAAACSPTPEDGAHDSHAVSPPDEDAASLLLVTLDTFRADAAGSGGAPDGRTRYLDRLARTGVQFETGLTVCPLTLPSHATMLTGLNPPEHGIRTNGTSRLPEDVPTLAAALRGRGFATGAFLAAFALDGKFGLGRGFDVYDDEVASFDDVATFEPARRRGDLVAAAAAAWDASLPPGQRRFEWVHLFDAHQPLDAPAPLLAQAGGVPYAADIAETDLYLGQVLRRQELSGRPSWVVVLGDHGESLGDHREDTHGLFIYGATMRIPAVIWPAPPGEPPGLHRATFRAQDLPATAFRLLGLDPSDAPGGGVDAFGSAPGPAYMESFFAKLHHGWAELRAVRDDRWKYVRAPSPELYDLGADPGETSNVHAEHPEEAARLDALLDGFLRAERTSDTVDLDAASREALESLGYVTGTVETDDAGALPDPKDMVRVTELLTRAQKSWGVGGGSVSRGLLGRALSLDPNNREIHKMMALLNAEAGRHDLAVDWFLRCLALPPFENDLPVRGELALSYLALGRPAEAAAELETIVSRDPDDPSSWQNLGVARMRLGRVDDAVAAWHRALELDPGFEPALISLERAGAK